MKVQPRPGVLGSRDYRVWLLLLITAVMGLLGTSMYFIVKEGKEIKETSEQADLLLLDIKAQKEKVLGFIPPEIPAPPPQAVSEIPAKITSRYEDLTKRTDALPVSKSPTLKQAYSFKGPFVRLGAWSYSQAEPFQDVSLSGKVGKDASTCLLKIVFTMHGNDASDYRGTVSVESEKAIYRATLGFRQNISQKITILDSDSFYLPCSSNGSVRVTLGNVPNPDSTGLALYLVGYLV